MQALLCLPKEHEQNKVEYSKFILLVHITSSNPKFIFQPDLLLGTIQMAVWKVASWLCLYFTGLGKI